MKIAGNIIWATVQRHLSQTSEVFYKWQSYKKNAHKKHMFWLHGNFCQLSEKHFVGQKVVTEI